jgi:hypothetical protein
VLTVDRDGEDQTVRVYDGAHVVNDLHRCAPAENNRRRPATAVPWRRDAAAIAACIDGYDETIRAWDR